MCLSTNLDHVANLVFPQSEDTAETLRDAHILINGMWLGRWELGTKGHQAPEHAPDLVAMAAGRKKARELEASGSLPGGGVGTVSAGQDSEVLTW